MRSFNKASYDFMGWRKIAISVSLIAILISVVSLVAKGGPTYNIDFLGGTELQIQFLQPKDSGNLRTVLASIDYAGAEIKQFGATRNFLIRIQEQDVAAKSTEKIMTALKQNFSEDPPHLLATNVIGPKIGSELRESAIWAVLVTLVLLLFYIGFRFDFIFGVGAIFALFHDVLITLGLFSVLNLEISIAVMAAFLTLVGYSLNDTIVVFDRIRENLRFRKRKDLPVDQVINRSINETLSRTMVTSATTLIVVVVCLFFGGEVLRDFFLCLLFGVLVGTYSSIFIATPVVAGWHDRRHVWVIERNVNSSPREKNDKISSRKGQKMLT